MMRALTLALVAVLSALAGSVLGATTIVVGITPITAVSHQFLTAMSAAGVFTQAQPASTDLSDASGLAYLATSQSFTKGQAVTVVADGTQSAGGTLTMDFSAGNYHSATFGAGNLTIANPSNIKSGECGFLALTQDATGSRTATWGTDWKWAGGTAPTLTTAANAVDLITWCAADTSTLAAQLAIANYK